MIIELNEQNFDKEALHGLKVIEFYTTWCMYCKRQRIELIDLENSDVWIGIVDGDESPNLAKKYKISGFPTFILLKDGEEIARFSGFHDKSQLLAKLTKHIV
ncbi:thioredoxin family protein [bacterium]|nr:thioredoxin family protein [bacterium]